MKEMEECRYYEYNNKSLSGEIIHVHVGQAGVQIANACWELYCLEHGIAPNGCMYQHPMDESYTTFFANSSGLKMVPRMVMVDSEPTVIDEVRTGTYGNLFRPETLITGKEDSGSNFGRGYNTLGTELIEITMNSLRCVSEACCNLRGFILFRSIGGGTGSGLGNRILEEIIDEYGKITKLDFTIFPSPSLSPLIVEPYNSVLATHVGMDASECSFILDNEALYDICENKLEVPSPTYTNLNRIIAQVASALTAPQRFYGSMNVSFTDFQTNLVPFPRIHFPLVSYAPLVTTCSAYYTELSTDQMTLECFHPSNQLVRCDPSDGRYMACILLYRGNVAPVDVNASISLMKSKNILKFVDWSPTGFKIGINSMPPYPVPGGDVGPTDRAMMALMNNTAIRKAWCRLIDKFNHLYSRRSFIHHFTCEGIEENVFLDASEDICSLISDYNEVYSLSDDADLYSLKKKDSSLYSKRKQEYADPYSKRKTESESNYRKPSQGSLHYRRKNENSEHLRQEKENDNEKSHWGVRTRIFSSESSQARENDVEIRKRSRTSALGESQNIVRPREIIDQGMTLNNESQRPRAYRTNDKPKTDKERCLIRPPTGLLPKNESGIEERANERKSSRSPTRENQYGPTDASQKGTTARQSVQEKSSVSRLGQEADAGCRSHTANASASSRNDNLARMKNQDNPGTMKISNSTTNVPASSRNVNPARMRNQDNSGPMKTRNSTTCVPSSFRNANLVRTRKQDNSGAMNNRNSTTNVPASSRKVYPARTSYQANPATMNTDELDRNKMQLSDHNKSSPKRTSEQSGGSLPVEDKGKARTSGRSSYRESKANQDKPQTLRTYEPDTEFFRSSYDDNTTTKRANNSDYIDIHKGGCSFRLHAIVTQFDNGSNQAVEQESRKCNADVEPDLEMGKFCQRVAACLTQPEQPEVLSPLRWKGLTGSKASDTSINDSKHSTKQNSEDEITQWYWRPTPIALPQDTDSNAVQESDEESYTWSRSIASGGDMSRKESTELETTETNGFSGDNSSRSVEGAKSAGSAVGNGTYDSSAGADLQLQQPFQDISLIQGNIGSLDSVDRANRDENKVHQANRELPLEQVASKAIDSTDCVDLKEGTVREAEQDMALEIRGDCEKRLVHKESYLPPNPNESGDSTANMRLKDSKAQELDQYKHWTTNAVPGDTGREEDENPSKKVSRVYIDDEFYMLDRNDCLDATPIRSQASITAVDCASEGSDIQITQTRSKRDAGTNTESEMNCTCKKTQTV